jgi:hypothetical protein
MAPQKGYFYRFSYYTEFTQKSKPYVFEKYGVNFNTGATKTAESCKN